jgi:riboflavin kinase/FMN adenylyltransferase
MAALVSQRDATPLPPGTGACIGAFDGLHRGHQALIRHAAGAGGPVALVTFDPHPLTVLAPARAPELLLSPAVRRRVAASLGVTHLVLLPFDRQMAALAPEAFIDRYLVRGLQPTRVVVGRDFRFGHGRAGTAEALAEALAAAEIETRIVEPVAGPESVKLGATEVRNAVREGLVAEVAHMLGRWHAVSGTVVRGHQRGRTIGFPTANVVPDPGLLPPNGVYAAFVSVWSPDAPDFRSVLPAVANLGTNPTFSAGESAPPRTLEVHALDVDLGERLYGVDVEVAFVARLRDERRFDGPAALVEQIQRDVAAARLHFGDEARARVLVPTRS